LNNKICGNFFNKFFLFLFLGKQFFALKWNETEI